ncbi:haloacid dehalogenase [Phlyctema vagabunda]|uniref:Haloacid dehalogenase n=1 Tax=Phlyctema vagabunda TaxID=108571 RepID=A0ABR4PMN4_9HELO
MALDIREIAHRLAPKYDILATPPKALLFDVFGTVVDWRYTVLEVLVHSAAAKMTEPADIPTEVRTRLFGLRAEDWARFAQEWRDTYKTFTGEYDPREDEWVDIDTHNRTSLIALLRDWELEGLYSEDEIEDLSKVWHFLDPWKDSSAGLQKLGTKFVTSTLSNGNQSLLKDLNKHARLGFQKIQSSADFKAYKPHPSVYRGAAAALGLPPSEVALVAAHLNDLKGARDVGFKTIYVERKEEEDWHEDEDRYADAKKWVDMWVTTGEEGFFEVARRFGIE